MFLHKLGVPVPVLHTPLVSELGGHKVSATQPQGRWYLGTGSRGEFPDNFFMAQINRTSMLQTLLKSDVSGLRVQIYQVTINREQHILFFG